MSTTRLETTRLVAEHVRGDELQGPALAYGATMTAMAFVYSLVWFYAIAGGRLLREDADPLFYVAESSLFGGRSPSSTTST